VKSGVLCRSSSALLRTRGALEANVASSLTDVWQQLFEQQDITVICIIHFQPWLHENHTSAPAPGDTDWNVVSFIDQTTDQWQNCFNACLKVKSKH